MSESRPFEKVGFLPMMMMLPLVLVCAPAYAIHALGAFFEAWTTEMDLRNKMAKDGRLGERE